jgi:hypothetical protein
MLYEKVKNSAFNAVKRLLLFTALRTIVGVVFVFCAAIGAKVRFIMRRWRLLRL